MVDGTQSTAGLSADDRREMLRKILERNRAKPRILPLSMGQEALWFLDRLDPGRPTYGFYPAVHIRGLLDPPTLQRAVAELIRRHDVFRTTFPEVDGGPVQRIAQPEPYTLPIVDLSHLPPAVRDAECHRLADERPAIDLLNGPVLFVRLIRLSDVEHVVTLHIHHIVFDGWSLGVLARELLALYTAMRAGRPSPLPPLPLQFADFAAWQRQYLQGGTLEQLQDYWRKRLAGLPPLELPLDNPRPAVRTSRGGTLPLALSADVSRGIVDFSRSAHFTPFMTLLAGFQELLRRYSGQDDFAIGTPTANRRQKNFEPLIGYFINVLVLRADVSGDPTFRQLVQRVRDTALDAYQHQELTLDKIVEAVRPPRDLSRHPLFQVMFVVQNNPQPNIELPDIKLSPLGEMESGRAAKFELTVPLRATPRGFEGKINFNSDLFAPETVARMASHYELILAAALADPDRPLSRLALLNDAERRTIVVDWNARTAALADDRLLHERFAAHAAASPDAVAVVDGSVSWTYGELDQLSNQLARRLRERGVGPESTVAVCLERSGELIAALLAVLKAGGAYVPIDLSHAGSADERVRFILDDARIAVLVTQGSAGIGLELDDPRLMLLEREIAALNATSAKPLEHRAAAEHLAYVIYTSGSTGRPKGVMVTHGNLRNALLGWEQEYQLNDGVRAHLQMASFGFDVFTGDLTRALGTGGRLVFCPKEILLDAEQLLDLIRREQIDAAEFVPVVLRNLVQHLSDNQAKLDTMRLVAVGSDAWYVEDHQRALAVIGPKARLVNSYGLTETTIDSSYFSGEVRDLPPTGIVPIGRAFPNVRMYVLDRWLRPVPIGVPGELCIGGAGVARGYLNRPELDGQRFVADPFAESPAARMCRTGDRVRWRTDGQLEFLGRADDQVKIRGFRIEPGEVEEVLREHPQLAEAAVVARSRGQDDLRLVAYVAGHGSEPLDPTDLRRFLSQRLPDYMVPSAFVVMATMPTTPSGKVDRRSLPEPAWDEISAAGEHVEPRTELERRLVPIWTEVLNISKVSVVANFFEIGGNSLLAVRLVARIRREFDVELPLVMLFTSPTIAALSDRISELMERGVRCDTAPIPRASRDQRIPLTFSQDLYWQLVQLFPNQPAINIYANLMIEGDLHVETLKRTIEEIVRRHESLRTKFLCDDTGEPIQLVMPTIEFDLPVNDLRELSDTERQEAVRRLAREQASLPFVLDELPLFRVRLLRLGDRSYAMLTTVAHIIFDSWALQVLMREVSEIYEAFHSGLPSPLPPLPAQFADFAVWERSTMQGEYLARLLDYWRNKLAGVTSPRLSVSHPAQPGVRHTREYVEFKFSDDLRTRIDRFVRAEGVTRFVFFLTAFKALLHRFGGQDDMAVAIPVANRGRAETQRMIGVFVNTIFLRSDLSGDPTFRAMLAQERQVSTEAMAREELPLPLLVQELQPDYDTTRFPFVQILFNYLQPDASQSVRRRRELEFKTIATVRDPVSTRSDLSVLVAESQSRLRGNFKFDAAVFDRADVELLTVHYQALLSDIIDHPEWRLSQLNADQSFRGAAPPPNATPSPPKVAEVTASAGVGPASVGPAADSTATTRKGHRQHQWLASLRGGGRRMPLFCIHGLGGHIAGFLPLAKQLREGRPVYGLQGQGLDGLHPPHDRIDRMAECYLEEIRDVQPHGPYAIAGWSLGGLIALELARMLLESGQRVALLAMIDTYLRVSNRDVPEMTDASLLVRIAPQLRIPLGQLQGMSPQRQWELVAERAAESVGAGVDEIRQLADTCRAHMAAVARYPGARFEGAALLVRSAMARVPVDPRWSEICPNLEISSTPGDHYSLLQRPHVDVLAAQLDKRLAAAEQADPRELSR